MKKLTAIIAATAATSTFAFDYKFNLESRVDLVNSSTETTTRSSGAVDKDTANDFSLNMLRLNMFGNVNESLSYRMRYRFNKDNTDTTRDAATKNLDFIYVDHKNSLFTLRLGKQSWSEAYGRESFVAATDAILTSAVKSNYGSTPSNTPTVSAIGEYRLGATAFTNIAGHNIALSLSNPNMAKTSTSGSTTNESLAYGFHYNSSLFDKMLQPVFSYLVAEQDGDKNHATAASKTKSVKSSLIAAGIRSQASDFTLDVDYKVLRQPSIAMNGATSNKVKTTSMTATLSYAMGNMIPFVMYFNDAYKSDVIANSYKRDQYSVGLMYKPFADLNYRYHVAYVSSSKKWDNSTSTSSKEEIKQIVLGFKADI